MFTRHYPNSKQEVVFVSRLMKAGELRQALQAEKRNNLKERNLKKKGV